MNADLTKRSRVNRGYIPMALRSLARRARCEACNAIYGTWVQTSTGRWTVALQALDHIFPRRWLLNFGLDPNLTLNLISVCRATCHPQKIKAENALFEGDALKYVQELRRLHWPANRIRPAAEAYRLREVMALLDREGRIG